MASGNSITALALSIAGLLLVVWAMLETERSRDIYNPASPASYSASAQAAHAQDEQP